MHLMKSKFWWFSFYFIKWQCDIQSLVLRADFLLYTSEQIEHSLPIARLNYVLEVVMRTRTISFFYSFLKKSIVIISGLHICLLFFTMVFYKVDASISITKPLLAITQTWIHVFSFNNLVQPVGKEKN